MINIKDKQQCCGCGACVQKCPKQSISLHEDKEGFFYPHVDTEACIDCGLCEKVCPVLNPYETREPLQVLAAINKDEKIRRESSSGGIFTLLADPIICEGGVVFGARFDEEWQVTLDYTETIEGLAAFRGSKYVQACTGETYKQCEQFLKAGRKVLFTGTPCQIAGLHHYLRKQYDNLTTCDFVCHGVPSPKVWRMYLKEVINGVNKTITDIGFRNKDNGWKRFNFTLSTNERGCYISSYHQENEYMKAFLRDMILRPSCYSCKAKCGKSLSDITIADYWGIDKTHPEMDDDKGTGLIIVNTQKGADSLNLYYTKHVETTYNDALRNNKGLGSITTPHYNRNKFFARIDKVGSLIDWINICLMPQVTLKRLFRHPLSSIKILIKTLMGG